MHIYIQGADKTVYCEQYQTCPQTDDSHNGVCMGVMRMASYWWLSQTPLNFSTGIMWRAVTLINYTQPITTPQTLVINLLFTGKPLTFFWFLIYMWTQFFNHIPAVSRNKIITSRMFVFYFWKFLLLLWFCFFID